MASIRKRAWTTPKGEARVAWQVDYRDLGGKRRHKQFERKKDADRFRRRVEDEVERGVHTPDRATVTVAAAVDAWLRDCERRWRRGEGMAGYTLDAYRRFARLHVLPALGGIRLNELTARRIQDWADDLAERYQRRSVAHIVCVLRGALKHAHGLGWLRRNPLADQPVVVRRARVRDRPSPPTPDEIAAILATLRERLPGETRNGYRNRVLLVLLALFTGMRKGELCGLQWADVDWGARVINVRHSYSQVDGLKAPKTRSGLRTVPLAPPVYEALAEHARWRGRAEGYVLVNRTGGPLLPSHVRQHYWVATLRAAGLLRPDGSPRFPFHSLRHAAVSLLIAQGLQPFHLKQVIGHSTVATTLDVYGHLYPQDLTIGTAMAGVAARFDAPPPPRSLAPEPVRYVDLRDERERAERKARAVALCRAGYLRREVAEAVGVLPATVSGWLREAEAAGGGASPGRECNVDATRPG